MSDSDPMIASEICYRYSSVLEDSIRDRLWGERDSLRGQVKAIMESHGLIEKWNEHAELHGFEPADFVEKHFSGESPAREAVLSRCAEIERLTKEWQDFYYGLKKTLKLWN
jgi:hypothetical protein